MTATAWRVASLVLTNAGAEVKACSSAAEAAQDWRPDVLVLDLEMPREDGYSVLRKLRAPPRDICLPSQEIQCVVWGRDLM